MFVVFFKGEPPIVDSEPQQGADATCVSLEVDERAMKVLKALDALSSFELAHALGAVYLAGVRAGERVVRNSGG